MEPMELCELAAKICQGLSLDDYSILGARQKEQLIRFSNNSVSVSKSFQTLELKAYIALEGRRLVGTSTDLTERGVRNFLETLVKACKSQRKSPDYTPLPSGPFTYPGEPEYDPQGSKEPGLQLELVKVGINEALKHGAKRCAGSLAATDVELAIMTSGGVKRSERSSSYLFNMRAFADSDSSGHGLACSPSLKGLDVERAGREAGDYARRMREPSACEEGTYDLIMGPTVAADILQHVGEFASAFSVQLGISFFCDYLEREVAPQAFSLIDHGIVKGGFEGRSFDDEGHPTQSTTIIEKGVAKALLHNSTTAKRFNTTSTGNAGIIDPHPWQLEASEGDMEIEEMIREVRRGILVTNNWYTRFQDLRSGAYSTLPRDAAFLIEGGEIKKPIAGFRISDSLPRQLNALVGMSRERRWIRWWEVRIPTLAPYLWIKEVRITRAMG